MIFTFLIASIFTLATVLIGTLTFGFGLIPLGIFAANSLTTALGSIAFYNLNLLFEIYSTHKIYSQYKAEKFEKPSQVEPLIDKKENENDLTTDDQGKKPNNLEGQGKGEPNLFD